MWCSPLQAMHVLGVLCIVPPPAGLGHCGGRLDGALDRLGLLNEDSQLEIREEDLTRLFGNRGLISRLNKFTKELDPLRHMWSYRNPSSREQTTLRDPSILRERMKPSIATVGTVSTVRIIRPWNPRQKSHRIRATVAHRGAMPMV